MEYSDDWDLGLPSYYAGVHVGLGNNLMLTARAANMDDGDYRYYTAAITYKFGKGSRFAARDFVSTFPGY